MTWEKKNFKPLFHVRKYTEFDCLNVVCMYNFYFIFVSWVKELCETALLLYHILMKRSFFLWKQWDCYYFIYANISSSWVLTSSMHERWEQSQAIFKLHHDDEVIQTIYIIFIITLSVNGLFLHHRSKKFKNLPLEI